MQQRPHRYFGEFGFTHHNDMRRDLIALLRKKREVQSSKQIVALTALSPCSRGDQIVISLSALPFLDGFCKRVGIVDEQVFFPACSAL